MCKRAHLLSCLSVLHSIVLLVVEQGHASCYQRGSLLFFLFDFSRFYCIPLISCYPYSHQLVPICIGSWFRYLCGPPSEYRPSVTDPSSWAVDFTGAVAPERDRNPVHVFEGLSFETLLLGGEPQGQGENVQTLLEGPFCRPHPGCGYRRCGTGDTPSVPQ